MVRTWFSDSVCGYVALKKARLLSIWIFKNVDRFVHLNKHDDTSVKVVFIIFPLKFAF